MNSKNTILICSNYAWTLINFRLPLIKSLINEGYRVEVITQYDGYENELEKIVDKVHPLFISRQGLNPFIDFITFLNILVCLLKVRPSVFMPFTIKPVIYGSMASRFARVHHISTITGLGTVFIKNNWITKIVKKMYLLSLKSVSVVFFQNASDQELFVNGELVRIEKTALIQGSGIDINTFLSSKEPSYENTTFILIARMLWDKGVGEFVGAAKNVKALYPNVKFQLLGPLGVQNPTSISEHKIQEWEAGGDVKYLGDTIDVRPYIEAASCVVLPSYREGLSRVLLEASAMSRPIIASDVPGCREIVDDKMTGFLCEVRSVNDLTDKMVSFISLSESARSKMGHEGRIKIKREYTVEKVCKKYLESIKVLVS